MNNNFDAALSAIPVGDRALTLVDDPKDSEGCVVMILYRMSHDIIECTDFPMDRKQSIYLRDALLTKYPIPKQDLK